ncbi:T3SS effector OspC family protein [Acerihabitans sp. KWT182]|uniref:T3SS effector OspC family protein n=1 Tax=Acerihabitans sp. KWT182 TaxID=3157919 RepID=A0AAU7Q6W2_9GAMM
MPTNLLIDSPIAQPHPFVYHSAEENGDSIAGIKTAANVTICRNSTKSPDDSARIIQRFFQKVIAARAYYNMFSNGSYFKELGHELPKVSGPPSFAALTHLDKISAEYLENIRAKTSDLNRQELALLERVIDANILLRHQSNSNLAENKLLKIFSNDYLSRQGINSGKNTFAGDKTCLSNHGFVFTAVEFAADLSQAPLNTKHSTVDFGANAYLIDEQSLRNKIIYYTLCDHFDNQQFPFFTHEHQEFIKQFPQAKIEAYRHIHGDKGVHDVPIFNQKDMKLALGLHLIHFIRSSKDPIFKEFALKKDMTEKELDRLINFVFQPECHIPQMVNTSRYSEKKLGDIPLKAAVMASNLKRLNQLVTSKNDACKAMVIAIEKAKEDIVDILLQQWEFTSLDIPIMRAINFGDIEYELSKNSASTKILRVFLERGLVEVNKIFKNTNGGDTMLDNAIKYDDNEMVCLLKKFGAVRGKELSGNNAQIHIR